MKHQPLFSRKNLEKKLLDFDLRISDLEQRQQRIANWQTMIDSGVIDSSKEEALQADFLNTFFGDVLSYIYDRSAPVWHLEKEFKSQTDGTKSDGALGFFSKDNFTARVLIELKDSRTDLDKKQHRKDRRTPIEQVFDYASKSGGQCRWVIVSNFKEIRLYSYQGGQGKYELFDISELLENDNLARFFFLLHKNRLIREEGLSPVDTLFADREIELQDISKKFYDKYKTIRLDLFEYLKKCYSQHDDFILLNKTQKLMDRVIFVLFCSDRGLMPSGIFKSILSCVSQSFDMIEYKLWRQLTGLFHSIDKGNPPMDINKFNGGLFESDDIFDDLAIDDNTLKTLLNLSIYDFGSDLDVNILGHIFEQSISDLEEIRANLQKENFDTKQGKRKKEGIFYTPEYITKYIVEQAVGGWLANQRESLGFDALPELTETDYETIEQLKKQSLQDIEFEKIYQEKLKKAGLFEKVQKHVDFLKAYWEKLGNITILDPACGSGAFLNQAFDFVYKEGKSIHVELARLQLGQANIADLPEHILTHNLYGVDINDESVEITKLSLWLKTANLNKELADLDSNILLGNSLIDDSKVAGDKAFNWEERFANIMKNGGFDVIIGNPPYGVVFNDKEKYYLKHFDKLVPDYEIYIYFISLGILKLLKNSGYLFYIFPNTFLSILYGQKYRKKLIQNHQIVNIVDLSQESIFSDASVRNCIFGLKKGYEIREKGQFLYFNPENRSFVQKSVLNQRILTEKTDNWLNLPAYMSVFSLVDIINIDTKLGDFFEVSQGLIPYDKYRGHSEETIKNRIFHADHQKDKTYRKELKGGDLGRYSLHWNGSLWISYGDWIAAPREPKFFNQPRILIREITNGYLFCSYVEEEYYNTPSIINIIQGNNALHLKYLLTLLNSKVMLWYHSCTSPKAKKGLFPKILVNDVRHLPIPEISKSAQQPFIEKADLMLSLNKKLQTFNQKIFTVLKADLSLPKISKKLQNWYTLDWEQFDNELKKQKIKLSLEQKMQWLDFFQTQKSQAQAIADIIAQTDREIDKMVYQLYDLTEEEIKIVENKK